MKPDFKKYSDGLIPTIVQDINTGKVLMLGFMNEEALELTIKLGKVTFFSRAKQRLWTKGEKSGNFLVVKEMLEDCDHDTLLIKAVPAGPVCHYGTDTCFGEANAFFTLKKLEQVIGDRKANMKDDSYTSKIFGAGINKIAQKLGEEAVELVIESLQRNDQNFLNEAADLLYHYMILLQAKNFNLEDVTGILAKRHKLTRI